MPDTPHQMNLEIQERLILYGMSRTQAHTWAGDIIDDVSVRLAAIDAPLLARWTDKVDAWLEEKRGRAFCRFCQAPRETRASADIDRILAENERFYTVFSWGRDEPEQVIVHAVGCLVSLSRELVRLRT